jgi:hypothetical protein
VQGGVRSIESQVVPSGIEQRLEHHEVPRVLAPLGVRRPQVHQATGDVHRMDAAERDLCAGHLDRWLADLEPRPLADQLGEVVEHMGRVAEPEAGDHELGVVELLNEAYALADY